MRRKTKWQPGIKCNKCGYFNHLDFVKYSGVCNGCKNILDEKAYFKAQMNKKLRLWRGKRFKDWGYRRDEY